MPPAMERVDCGCKQCGFRLGELLNLWTQVGKSYYSPVLDAPVPLAVRSHGDVRTGEPHTLVGECDLQDIACASCHAVVGLRCVRTPPNHVLAEGQVLLRSISVAFGDPQSGGQADLTVKRWLRLKGLTRAMSDSGGSPLSTSHQDAVPKPQPFPGSLRTAPDSPDPMQISQIRADLETHREDIDRLDSTGYQVVNAFNDAVARVEGHVRNLEGFLHDVKRGLDGNDDDLASLKIDLNHVRRTAENTSAISDIDARIADMAKSVAVSKEDVHAISMLFHKDIAEFKAELLQVRQEATDFKLATSSVIQDHARELESLRNEVSTLKQQLDQTRTRQTRTTDAGFPARELDILTSSIAKIGNRASQVETLHMELEILKGRVRRVEASGSNVFTHEVSHANTNATEVPNRPTEFPLGLRPTRPSSAEISPEQTRLRSKRPAHSMQRPAESSLRRHQATATGPTNPTRLPATVIESGPKKARLTRAGASSKKHQKRIPKDSLAGIDTATGGW